MHIYLCILYHVPGGESLAFFRSWGQREALAIDLSNCLFSSVLIPVIQIILWHNFLRLDNDDTASDIAGRQLTFQINLAVDSNQGFHQRKWHIDKIGEAYGIFCLCYDNIAETLHSLHSVFAETLLSYRRWD